MTFCQQKTFAITLLVCSAGGGHTSAARALTEAFARRYPACEVSTVYIEDIIGGVGKSVGRLYAALYNTALARGWYRLEPVIFALLKITTRYLYPLAIPALRRSLPAQTAHAWITLIHGAHPVLNHVLAHRDTLRFTVVTDAVTLRPSWLNPADICTFVSTDQAYQACIHAGLRPAQVRNLGHPVSPDFALPKPLSGESLFFRSPSSYPFDTHGGGRRTTDVRFMSTTGSGSL